MHVTDLLGGTSRICWVARSDGASWKCGCLPRRYVADMWGCRFRIFDAGVVGGGGGDLWRVAWFWALG